MFLRINFDIFALMIALFVLSQVEIYVLLAVAAAAVVAVCVKPASRGEAIEHLLGGRLCSLSENGSADEPAGDFDCDESGNVLLLRRGLTGLTDADAVSLAITVIGFDVRIEERVAKGRGMGNPVDAAVFTLDFLGHERYHVIYRSEVYSLAASLTLHNRPGLHAARELKVDS